MHGGLTPRGPALPQFKHGRYSRLLPLGLAARYREALADTDLLALREEIALTDARVGELLGRLDTGESGALWRELRRAVGDLRDARAGRDAGRLVEAVGRVEALVAGGQSDARAWQEIGQAVERRRRLVESEARRLALARQVIPVEEAMALLGAVLDSVRRHVPDERARADIAGEVQALLNRGG